MNQRPKRKLYTIIRFTTERMPRAKGLAIQEPSDCYVTVYTITIRQDRSSPEKQREDPTPCRLVRPKRFSNKRPWMRNKLLTRGHDQAKAKRR